MDFGRSTIQRFDIDWRIVGLEAQRLDGLVGFMLRILQSFVVDPGRPPRTGEPLRGYLREWVAPAVNRRDG